MDTTTDVGSARDPDFIRRAQPVLELYTRYFRPEVRGFENLPVAGPFLVVGNHSGGSAPPDIPILMTAWWRERGVEEPVYALFHSTFLSMPGVGAQVAKAGALEAGHGNAEAVLRDRGVVLVYPGGDREAFRPWRDRNRIDFSGRTGFIRLALRTQVPIVPSVSIGAHETIFVLTRGDRIAKYLPHLRAMRVKTQPIVLGPPTGISLGWPTFPFPAQVTVQLCPPIDWRDRYSPDAADNDDVVAACYDEVVTTMQRVLDDLATERAKRQ
jgi:1-acyl-sn-glycerol-3-phosphate acyltransferase